MNRPATFSVVAVRTTDDIASVMRLYFEAEMEAMPGQYSPPAGELLLARNAEGWPVGCVGLRPIETNGCCEMKRLYVASEGRGYGVGRRLVDAVVREAERIGYSEMRLDTLPSMAEPYYDTPVVGTIFMRRLLTGC
jgi:GNAT superfamily N-acetyltransferase